MATAEAHPGGLEAWAESAREQLTAHGYKAGGARMAVVELLGSEGGCLEAEEVAGRLRELGKTVGTASVYRALALLAELRLLHKVALPGAPARFELILPHGEHHHHIVCDRCGRTAAFSDDELETAVAAISRRTAFEVQAHDVTLHGLCEDCQAA